MQRPYENHLLAGFNTSENYVIATVDNTAVFINNSAAQIIGINMLGEPICDIIGEELGSLVDSIQNSGTISMAECDFFGCRCILHLLCGSPALYIFTPLKSKEPDSDIHFPSVSLLGLSAELRRLISPFLFLGSECNPVLTRSGYQMIRLINNLADYIRYNSDNAVLNPERIDIVALCEKLIASVRPILEIKDIPIRFESSLSSCSIELDPQLIRRMILNLINNSAKYTQEGNHIVFRLNMTSTQCYIVVTDHGAGISEENIANIFNAYEAYDFPRLVGGYGLGLALARTIALLHGGSIVLESKLGIGTNVTVSLPLKKNQGPQTQAVGLGNSFDIPLLELSEILNTDEFILAQNLHQKESER